MKPTSSLEILPPGPSSTPGHRHNRRRTDQQPVDPGPRPALDIAGSLPFPWRGIQAWVEELFAFYDPPPSP